MSEMRDGLSERGKAIWDAYEGDKLPAGNQALVHEAARLADTLDQFARLAAGDVDTWAKLNFEDGTEVTLDISSMIAERRQQQLAFKQLLMEIRQMGLKQVTHKPEDETANVDSDDGDVILQFQRRAERQAG